MIANQIKEISELVIPNEGRVIISRKNEFVIKTHIGVKVKRTHLNAIKNRMYIEYGGCFEQALAEEDSFKILTTIREVNNNELIAINLLNNRTEYSQLPDVSGKGFLLLGLNGYYTKPKFRGRGFAGMINGYHTNRISKLLKEQGKLPEKYSLSVQDHVYKTMKKTAKGNINIVDFDYYDIIGSC